MIVNAHTFDQRARYQGKQNSPLLALAIFSFLERTLTMLVVFFLFHFTKAVSFLGAVLRRRVATDAVATETVSAIIAQVFARRRRRLLRCFLTTLLGFLLAAGLRLVLWRRLRRRLRVVLAGFLG